MDTPVFKSRPKNRSSGTRSFGGASSEDTNAKASGIDDGSAGLETLTSKVKKAARMKPKAKLSFGDDGDEVRVRIVCLKGY